MFQCALFGGRISRDADSAVRTCKQRAASQGPPTSGETDYLAFNRDSDLVEIDGRGQEADLYGWTDDSAAGA